MTPNVELARTFLKNLDPIATSFTFQVFDDKKPPNKKLAKYFHGSFDECINKLIHSNNGVGCGVFITINETDLKGRSASNIKRVRAVFVDLDGSPLEPVKTFELKPHFIIESSPNKYHAYWFVYDLPISEFKMIQKGIAEIFNGDKAVHDLPRVM